MYMYPGNMSVLHERHSVGTSERALPEIGEGSMPPENSEPGKMAKVGREDVPPAILPE